MLAQRNVYDQVMKTVQVTTVVEIPHISMELFNVTLENNVHKQDVTFQAHERSYSYHVKLGT